MMSAKILIRSSSLAESVCGVISSDKGGFTIGMEDLIGLRFLRSPLLWRSLAPVCGWVGSVLVA